MPWPPTDRPVIVIDPAVGFGRPQIRGITTEAIAGRVMAGDGVDDTADDFGITRHETLLACWWEGTRGRYQRQWGEWANAAHRMLGGWEPLDLDAMPEPPDRTEVPEPKRRRRPPAVS